MSATFAPATITVDESTALTLTITNPSANTVALTGVALADTLPAGLAVAAPNGLSGSCGAGTITAAPGSQSVTLFGDVRTHVAGHGTTNPRADNRIERGRALNRRVEITVRH